MDINPQKAVALGIKLSIKDKNKEIARAYLYILKNNLHKNPFGFLEDVHVDSKYRGRGFGKKMVQKVIEEAKKNKCYKLIAGSRYSREKVHKLYKGFKFKDHGIEFRLDFKK